MAAESRPDPAVHLNTSVRSVVSKNKELMIFYGGACHTRSCDALEKARVGQNPPITGIVVAVAPGVAHVGRQRTGRRGLSIKVNRPFSGVPLEGFACGYF
jgi:hypothetical protein